MAGESSSITARRGWSEGSAAIARLKATPRFLFDVEDRLVGPGVPVHDPKAILGRDRVQVHTESAKFREDGVRRLGGNDDESAAPRLQAFREEREGEPELLLARRALQDDARSDG